MVNPVSCAFGFLFNNSLCAVWCVCVGEGGYFLWHFLLIPTRQTNEWSFPSAQRRHSSFTTSLHLYTKTRDWQHTRNVFRYILYPANKHATELRSILNETAYISPRVEIYNFRPSDTFSRKFSFIYLLILLPFDDWKIFQSSVRWQIWRSYFVDLNDGHKNTSHFRQIKSFTHNFYVDILVQSSRKPSVSLHYYRRKTYTLCKSYT